MVQNDMVNGVLAHSTGVCKSSCMQELLLELYGLICNRRVFHGLMTDQSDNSDAKELSWDTHRCNLIKLNKVI